ncbi:MAG: endonuclease V [bacterium]|nr:endonuclease V [bacterium]
MHIPDLHDWNLSPQEAIALQNEMKGQVVDDVPLPLADIHTIAGIDVSVRDDISTAAIVVLSFPEMGVIESVRAKLPTPFPYIPGLLSFREIPVLLEAFAGLKTTPDVLMVDGMGKIHPRKLGIACHLGLWLKLPSLGVGKTPFIGTYDDPAPQKGAMSNIVYHDEVLGVALRTRDNTKPLYISVGHLMNLESAIAITMACVGNYKQPEPIRQAHNTAGMK